MHNIKITQVVNAGLTVFSIKKFFDDKVISTM